MAPSWCGCAITVLVSGCDAHLELNIPFVRSVPTDYSVAPHSNSNRLREPISFLGGFSMSYSASGVTDPRPRRFTTGSPRGALAGLGAAAACSLLLSGCGGGSQANAAAPAAALASSSAATTVSAADVATKMTAAIKKAGSGKVVSIVDTDTTEATFQYTPAGLDQQVVHTKKGVVQEVVGVGGTFYVKGLPTPKDGWAKVAAGDSGPAGEQAKWLETSTASPLNFSELAKFGKLTTVSSSASGNSYEATAEACVLMNACDAKNSTGSPVKVSIQLDPQDRPLKFAMTSPFGNATATFSDWGKPVTVAAPKLDAAPAADEAAAQE